MSRSFPAVFDVMTGKAVKYADNYIGRTGSGDADPYLSDDNRIERRYAIWSR